MSTRTVTVTLTEDQARTICGDEPAGGCHDSAFKPIREALNALPPVMDEPTYPGAVVMTDEGLAVRMSEGGDRPWMIAEKYFLRSWADCVNPRPLTPAERREHGIPEPLPEGYVAVKQVDDDAGANYFRWRAEAFRTEGYGGAATLLDAYADALEVAEVMGR